MLEKKKQRVAFFYSARFLCFSLDFLAFLASDHTEQKNNKLHVPIDLTTLYFSDKMSIKILKTFKKEN